MKIVSSEAMARIDGRAQAEFAFPSLVLMEDAGVKAWAALRRVVWGGRRPRGRLVFVAGRGNNGGDALVMARQAAVEKLPLLTVVLAGGRPERDTDPGRNLASCEPLGMEIIDWPVQHDLVMTRMAEAAWIIDGIAGTGIRGALRPPLSDIVACMNQSPGKRAALDVPSGVGDGYRKDFPAVRADVTLAMGLPKLCLYLPRARTLCGRIYVIPVGFPPALVEGPGIAGELLSARAWKRLARPIPPDTYKNRRGHLAVFAGSRGTTGAAWSVCNSSRARPCRAGHAFCGCRDLPGSRPEAHLRHVPSLGAGGCAGQGRVGARVLLRRPRRPRVGTGRQPGQPGSRRSCPFPCGESSTRMPSRCWGARRRRGKSTWPAAG